MQSPPLAARIWANASRLAGRPPGDRISVRDLVKVTGLPNGNLQRIYEGKNPTLATVEDLARAMRVDVHQLLAPEAAAPATVAEPAAPFRVATDVDLIEAVEQLVKRIPPDARLAFADVLSGWVRSGGEESRATALLALLRLPGKHQHAA